MVDLRNISINTLHKGDDDDDDDNNNIVDMNTRLNANGILKYFPTKGDSKQTDTNLLQTGENI